MYLEHFGLTKNPFSMTPDPGMLYVTQAHREALAGLAYAILERKGFAILTGEAGTGKTTLLTRVLQRFPASRVVSSVILNPTLTESEFMEMMMFDFGFRDVPASKAQRLLKLQSFITRNKEAGKIVLLVVDEAHKLTPSVLEEIRLLSNLEVPGEKLLQIVLAGQPEFVEILSRPGLRQLTQRITVRLSLDALSPAQVEEYIVLRWSKSGTGIAPFAADVYPKIAHWSRGIPRLVNAICDNALMLAFAERATRVESKHVEHACTDLWLVERERPKAAPLNGHGPVQNGANELLRPMAAVGKSSAPVRILDPVVNPDQSRWARWMAKLRPAE